MRPGLSFPEFLGDIRGVVVSPRRRFPLIQERGALWGSLLLLLFPAYVSMTWLAGIYFDRDPFPGYSFLVPAVFGLLITFVKLCPIHGFGRLFQSGGYRRAQGSFRQLVAVFGYTAVPNLLAIVVATLLFFGWPDVVGRLLRDFHAATVSVLVATGIALFVWHFILMVLALRTVYPMRDLKLVGALILGSAIGGGVGYLLFLPAMEEVKVNAAYLEPILSDRLLRFHSVEPGVSQEVTIKIPIDRLVYRTKRPDRFHLVAFTPSADYLAGRERQQGGEGARESSRRKPRKEERIVGRIVGLPGEQVQLASGRLQVADETWLEDYLAAAGQPLTSFRPRKLGPEEYLVLPENRGLLELHRDEWIVPRARITGRVLVAKWPIGQILYRPAVFQSARRVGTP